MKNKNNVITVNFGSKKNISNKILDDVKAMLSEPEYSEEACDPDIPISTETRRKTKTKITGNNNIVGNGNNITIKGASSPKISIVLSPDGKHISSEVAYKIKGIVDKLVELDNPSKSKSERYGKWWGALKKEFKVTIYKEIPADRGQDAINYLKGHLNIKMNAGYR